VVRQRLFLVLFVVLILIGTIILVPVFSKAQSYSGPGVQGQLHSLYIAMSRYADGNDGHLPSAESWMNDLQPDFQSDIAFMMRKAQPTWRDLGLVYFAPLSGSRLEDIEGRESVPLVFLSETVAPNAAGGLSLLAPLTEERRGFAVLFADGKVRIMPPDWRFETIVIKN
jgi:hypothetical protein